MGQKESYDWAEGPTIDEAVTRLGGIVREKGAFVDVDNNGVYYIRYPGNVCTRVTILQFHTRQGPPLWGAAAIPSFTG